jgi:hypothetical protein
MNEDPIRPLLHKVANLLGVILTQTTVARTAGTAEAALEALAHIERCARETEPLLRAARTVIVRGPEPFQGDA